jgi:hypothetical protein
MDGPSADLLHMLAILLSLLRKGSRIWRESELPQAFFLHASAAAGVCFRPQKYLFCKTSLCRPVNATADVFSSTNNVHFQTQLVLFYVHAAACVFCRAGTPRDLNPQNVSTNYISKRSIRLQEEHPTTRGASDYKRSIRLQEEHPTTRGAPIPRTISYTPFQPHPLANYVYIYRYTCIYTYIFTAFYLVFF